MTAKRKFNSDAFEAIHASASALLDVGAIDKTTMRQFDDTCLLIAHTQCLGADSAKMGGRLRNCLSRLDHDHLNQDDTP